MKGIQDRIAEKYPNHSQLEWDVLNGIVAIAKEYARDVTQETLNRAADVSIEQLGDGFGFFAGKEHIKNTVIITP